MVYVLVHESGYRKLWCDKNLMLGIIVMSF